VKRLSHFVATISLGLFLALPLQLSADIRFPDPPRPPETEEEEKEPEDMLRNVSVGASSAFALVTLGVYCLRRDNRKAVLPTNLRELTHK
jgi:hypothetical protein